MKSRRLLWVFFLFIVLEAHLIAQSTGKITGKITDASTGDPLIGANVVLAGTNYGAATDLDGEYVILKVPSGIYNLTATFIGYQRKVVENVQVLIDLTTRIDCQLNPSTLTGEEIVVVAEAPMIKKDLTATESRVTAQEIDALPIQDLGRLVGLQAGVSVDQGGGIHIRGGRSSEISYLVNGVSITDDYSRSQAITIETESIQELQVISGTFNAEYGNAMSGVVNVVTKSGGRNFDGSVEVWTGDYLSSHKDIFWGIDNVGAIANYNIQATLSGPILIDRASFFATLRRSFDSGFLNGIDRYSPQGRNTPGDGSIVSMNSNNRWSGQATLDVQVMDGLHAKVDAFGSLDRNRFYNHFYRLNPGGARGGESEGMGGIGKLTHQIYLTTFQELTLAFKYNGFISRLYGKPNDPRYVHPDSLNVPGYHFAVAGTDLNRSRRYTKSWIAKWDVTSQVNKSNLAKAGVEAQFDKVFYDNVTLVPARNANGQQIVPFIPFVEGIETPNHDKFVRTPRKIAAYVQNKIELENMIVNVGLRYELWDPNGRIPADQKDPNIYNPFKLEHIYRDVNGDGKIGLAEETNANKLTLKEREAFWYKKATRKFQLSPRFGVAYPITDKGIIRFSYGIFQQIPEYSQLYLGDQYKLVSAQQGIQGPFGNNDLKPQRTTIYELGLQQQLSDELAVDVTAFYRDIRDWITSSRPIPTFLAGLAYSKRINRDFANVRGVTFSLNKRFADHFSFGLDYTFQIADGTNSTPDEEFFSQVNGSEPTRTLTPLGWDQTHTLNSTFFVGSSDWGVSLISAVSTGQPYTPTRLGGEFTGRNVLTGLAENSRRKPLIARFDLELFKNFIVSGLNFQVFGRILNLFDAKNPINVYGDTGRPDFTLQEQEISGYDEGWFDNPTFFSEPRRIYVGTKVSF